MNCRGFAFLATPDPPQHSAGMDAINCLSLWAKAKLSALLWRASPQDWEESPTTVPPGAWLDDGDAWSDTVPMLSVRQPPEGR